MARVSEQDYLDFLGVLWTHGALLPKAVAQHLNISRERALAIATMLIEWDYIESKRLKYFGTMQIFWDLTEEALVDIKEIYEETSERLAEKKALALEQVVLDREAHLERIRVKAKEQERLAKERHEDAMRRIAEADQQRAGALALAERVRLRSELVLERTPALVYPADTMPAPFCKPEDRGWWCELSDEHADDYRVDYRDIPLEDRMPHERGDQG